MRPLLILGTTLALLLVNLPVTATAEENSCDVQFDVCVSGDDSGACAHVWLATHPVGGCADTSIAERPVCKVSYDACVLVGSLGEGCDKDSDLCFWADDNGACVVYWAATHPLGVCASVLPKPSVTVCTFTPPCRGI